MHGLVLAVAMQARPPKLNKHDTPSLRYHLSRTPHHFSTQTHTQYSHVNLSLITEMLSGSAQHKSFHVSFGNGSGCE